MKAVLFDMDGILIDTEKYLTVYKQKAMREAGYRLDLETAYKFRSCASVFARDDQGAEKTWLSDGSRDGYSGRQGCALSGNGRI